MHRLLNEIAEQPVLFRAFDYEITLDADRTFIDRFSNRNERS